MLSHPELVSTGLDLFSKVQGGHNYSTLVFYETGYNLFTMRQASRRAWRIGQPRDCRVYYLYYKETMQHKAMALMSKKMAAAQALEGEFSADGLAAMAGDDNLQMSMAKNLASRIDDTDMQRNWAKIKSGPKKSKKPGTAMVEVGKTIPASPLDGLPIEVQMVAETIIENQDKPVPKDAQAEFPGLAARLAELDAGFDAAAGGIAEDDEEITPGLMECSTGAGLGFSEWMENAVNGGEEAEAEEEVEEEDEDDDEPLDVLQMPKVELDDYVCPPINLAHLRAYQERERLRQEKKKLKLVSDEEVIERVGDERLEEEEDGVDDRLLEDADDEDDEEEEFDIDTYEPPPLTPEIMAKMFANLREHGKL